ncbi:hypothetical protein GCM10009603_56540 [Nocardiopsis exhalans]
MIKRLLAACALAVFAAVGFGASAQASETDSFTPQDSYITYPP